MCGLTIHCLRFSISNATLDLLMMAAWNLALASFPGERIPVSVYPLCPIRRSSVAISSPTTSREMIGYTRFSLSASIDIEMISTADLADR